jgi:hypothetical protein
VLLDVLRRHHLVGTRISNRSGAWTVLFDCSVPGAGRGPWEYSLPAVPPGRSRYEVERWLMRIQHGVGYSIPATWEVV